MPWRLSRYAPRWNDYAMRNIAALRTGPALWVWAVALLSGLNVQAEEAGYATCAAYYFLAARGHGKQDYDRLYTSGEFSFNEAARRHGKAAADAKMGEVSTGMMRDIHQDWRAIDILDKKYGAPCATLLQESGFKLK